MCIVSVMVFCSESWCWGGRTGRLSKITIATCLISKHQKHRKFVCVRQKTWSLPCVEHAQNHSKLVLWITAHGVCRYKMESKGFFLYVSFVLPSYAEWAIFGYSARAFWRCLDAKLVHDNCKYNCNHNCNKSEFQSSLTAIAIMQNSHHDAAFSVQTHPRCPPSNLHHGDPSRYKCRSSVVH